MVNIQYKKTGLTVQFTSNKVPAGMSYSWDFGDLTDVSTETKPTHTFGSPGYYKVKLTLTKGEDKPIEAIAFLGVNDKTKTTLSVSLFDLVDTYIPDILKEYFKDKSIYIDKWQLYLQPLVEHEIPLELYNDEFEYEALENQLIAELVAYDFFTLNVVNMLSTLTHLIQETEQSTGTGGSAEGEEGEAGNQKIKKIVTGPSEVEFFEGLSLETSGNLVKSINSALQPGGTVSTLKQKICMLSERLNIYLPICRNRQDVVIPKVVNKRKPGPLGGPNPTWPINS